MDAPRGRKGRARGSNGGVHASRPRRARLGGGAGAGARVPRLARARQDEHRAAPPGASRARSARAWARARLRAHARSGGAGRERAGLARPRTPHRRGPRPAGAASQRGPVHVRASRPCRPRGGAGALRDQGALPCGVAGRDARGALRGRLSLPRAEGRPWRADRLPRAQLPQPVAAGRRRGAGGAEDRGREDLADPLEAFADLGRGVPARDAVLVSCRAPCRAREGAGHHRRRPAIGGAAPRPAGGGRSDARAPPRAGLGRGQDAVETGSPTLDGP